MKEIEKFFWNFCDNYIEIVKRRLYNPDIYGKKATESAQFAIYNVLLGILKHFAIYLPHITEEVYQSYFKNFEKVSSIHLCELSTINIELNPKDVKIGEELIEIITKVRSYKSENNYSLKEEISKLIISGYDPDIKLAECDLKAVTSACEIEYVNGEKTIKIIK